MPVNQAAVDVARAAAAGGNFQPVGNMSPTNINNMQPNMTGINMTYGDLSSGGTQIQLWNPAQMDPSKLNPYANQYLQNSQNLYDMFSKSAAGGAFNPEFYNQMKGTQQDQMTSALGNQYARMGLSGSSAEMGGMQQAIQSNQMNWLNRQQQDQMRAMQGLEGLNNTMYGQSMGIQGQYGQYQDQALQAQLDLLGLKQQQDASSAGLWGDIAKGALAAGGFLLGGPAGAAGGAALGGAIGGGAGTGMNIMGNNPFSDPNYTLGQSYGGQYSLGSY